jgi:hypothetical protein
VIALSVAWAIADASAVCKAAPVNPCDCTPLIAAATLACTAAAWLAEMSDDWARTGRVASAVKVAIDPPKASDIAKADACIFRPNLWILIILTPRTTQPCRAGTRVFSSYTLFLTVTTWY